MRLQTFLSRAGISSRRNAIDIIKSGKVNVNNRTIFDRSFQVNPEKDAIFFENKRVLPKQYTYIMLNKPKGFVTTKKDRHAPKTIIDLIPKHLSHLNPAGRLDKDTSGLLLVTNDGQFINHITHPRFNIEKTYEAILDKKLSEGHKIILERGIMLDNKKTAPCQISIKGKNLIEMKLHEGRKRQIKRMFYYLGYHVLNLQRIKEGPLSIGNLPIGKWRFLKEEEVLLLKNEKIKWA